MWAERFLRVLRVAGAGDSRCGWVARGTTALSLLVAFLASPLSAESVYFDTSANAGFPANASFNWNTSTAQWGNSTGTLSPLVWANADLDDAVLGAGAGTSSYTATLGSNITVGRIQRVNGTWSLALGANTLTFNSATNWTLGAASGFGPISGTGAIVKAGTNTLTLSGQNTFSGGTTLSAGALRLESNTALGTGRLTVAGNNTTLQAGGTGPRTIGNAVTVDGNFTIGGNQDITFTNQISLGGGDRTLNITNSGVTTFSGVVSNNWYAPITKTGAGTLVLKGANTFTGPLLINEGIVNLQHNSALGGTGYGSTVASGAELQLQGGISVEKPDLKVQGSGTTGAGAINSISGANTLTTALNLAGATTIGVASGSLTLGGSLSGAQTLTTVGAGDILFKAGLSGSASINLNGTGTVTFGGTSANSNNGAVTINNGGTLILAKAAGTDALQAVVTINAGTLRLGAANQVPDWLGIVVGGSQGLFDLNNYNETIASLTMTGGAVTTGTGVLTLSGNSTVTTSAAATTATISGKLASSTWATTFTVADGTAATDLELAANFSGSTNLVKNGAGTMMVSGNNTYSGTTTIDLGTLKLGSAGSATTGPLGTTAGATLVNSGGALDLNGFTLASAEAFTLSGAGVGATGALTNSSATAVTVNGAVTLGSAATIGGVGNLTLTGSLGGNYLLTKAGNNTLALNGSGGARTGGAQVDAGTLRLGAADALGSAAQTVTLNGGVLDLASNSSTNAYGVTVAADATVRSNKATAGSAGITHTLGQLSIGSNRVTIQAGDNVAANSAFGVTFGATALTGAANLDVRNNGTGTGTLTLGNVSGAGSLTKSGAGTLTLGNTSTYTGATQIREGTVVISSLGNVGAANSSLGAPTTAAAGTIQIGSGSSNATLRYTGTGSTTNRVIDLAGTTGGATLDASGSGALVFSSAFTASGAGSKTLTLTGTSTAANTISGAIVNHSASDTTSLLKTGIGNWTLAGKNSFSGSINVNAGRLTLTANDALAARTNQVNVASGATFAVSGSGNTTTIGGLAGGGIVSIAGGTVLQVDHSAANTFSGRLEGAGRFVKQGTETFTFSSAANTSAFNFAGTFALESGTLAIQGGTASNALTFGTLEISGGTLFLSHAFINVGTLNITGDTILDFGTAGASILKATNIYIASGAIVTVRNWTSEVDFLFANSSFRQNNSSGPSAVPNTEGSAPQNQVHFEDELVSDGSNTAWTEYNNGYADHQIRPIPEPSTYGALLLGACASLVAFLRRRR